MTRRMPSKGRRAQERADARRIAKARQRQAEKARREQQHKIKNKEG